MRDDLGDTMNGHRDYPETKVEEMSISCRVEKLPDGREEGYCDLEIKGKKYKLSMVEVR